MEESNKVYVQHLTSNLKRRIDVNLGRKVLLVGDNGSGKSSFVDAYSLVTTGVGRSPGIGKGSEMKKAAVGDEGPFVEALTSEGEVLAWPADEARLGVDCTDETETALYSPKTLRKLVLRGLGDSNEQEDPYQEIQALAEKNVPQVYRETLQRIVNLGRMSSRGVRTTGAALAQLTGLVNDNRKDAAKRIKNAETMAGRAPSLSREEEEELTAIRNLSRHVSDLDTAKARDYVLKSAKTLVDESKAAKERINRVEVELQRLRSTASELRDRSQTLDNIHKATEATVNALGDSTPDDHHLRCPCCGQGTSAGDIRARHAELTAMIQKVAETVPETSHLVVKKREAEAIAERADKDLEDLKRAAEALMPFAQDERGPEKLQERLAFLEEKENRFRLASSEMEQSETFVNQKNALDAVLKALEALSVTEAADRFDIADARVNRLLPPRIRVNFVESGGGCVLAVSIDGNKPTSYRLLGGAERAIVKAAVSSALTSAQRGDDTISTIVIDDVWLRRPATTAVIGLIDEAINSEHGPSQAVLSVAEYDGNVPDDWTVVDLDAIRKEEGERVETAPETKDDGDGDSKSSETARDEELPFISTFARANGSQVGVYYLGEAKRFTEKFKKRVLLAPNLDSGVLGVALTGKQEDKLRAVTVAHGTVVEATLTSQEKIMLSSMIFDWRSGSSPAEQGEAGTSS